MCIGFSVDFTAHICYTYMSSKAKNPDDRVREALYSLGLPICQGSFSTILGVVALLLADSYIFLVFFKMVFLVIFFGAMHGLFLLPVLLSLFGPGSCGGGKAAEKEMKLSAVEKSYPHPYCIPHPQLALTGPFGSKNFLGAPYKAYGDDKDLGIGTSGEDSSESSSSKSQRRQAIEDENTRRRYEEGWRRSWHNVQANGATTPPSQFQPPVLDLYGHETERLWTRESATTTIRTSHRDAMNPRTGAIRTRRHHRLYSIGQSTGSTMICGISMNQIPKDADTQMRQNDESATNDDQGDTHHRKVSTNPTQIDLHHSTTSTTHDNHNVQIHNIVYATWVI